MLGARQMSGEVPTWWASDANSQDAGWATHCLAHELKHLGEIRARARDEAALDPAHLESVIAKLRVHAASDPERTAVHRLVLDDPRYIQNNSSQPSTHCAHACI